MRGKVLAEPIAKPAARMGYAGFFIFGSQEVRFAVNQRGVVF